jgi:drug/metabolite transporter (DMT)-like permease
MKRVRIAVLAVAAIVLVVGVEDLLKSDAKTGAFEIFVALIAAIAAGDALTRARRATRRDEKPRLQLWQGLVAVVLFGVMGALAVDAARTGAGVSAVLHGTAPAFLFSLAALAVLVWWRGRSRRQS